MFRRSGINIRGRSIQQNHQQIVNVGAGATGLVSDMYYLANDIDVYYTIEDHLSNFAGDGRFGYLWNNWCVEKREHMRQLETIQANFTEYSLHDKNHSSKIIASIERLLGPDRIVLLSPSDSWLILQCAFTHDLGMCISEDEKKFALMNKNNDDLKKITTQPEFKKVLDEMLNELRKQSFHYPNTHEHNITRLAAEYWHGNRDSLYSDQAFRDAVFGSEFSLAKYYYDIVINEWFRQKHAERSRDKLIDRRQLNVERDIIPGHMREAVAQINHRHCGQPECIMELKRRQNGFDSGDHIHPQFVAMLLRMGDLLDMETTRFNPYVLDGISEISSANLPFMLKDLSVTEILVDPRKICVTASFDTKHVESFLERHKPKSMNKKGCDPDTLNRYISSAVKCMRDWMNYIKANSTWFMQVWNEIVPDGFPGYASSPSQLKILLDGHEVDERDMDLKYEIDPSRAAQIIEGAGLYGTRLVFLREIIQNAIDATKIKLFRDYRDDLIVDSKAITFLDFLDKYGHFLQNRAIEVNFSFHDDNKTPDDDEKGVFYVTIIDKGIGITRARLNEMKHIGAVKNRKIEDEIKRMPVWLRPTADFGIGMQSAFLISDQFEIKSRPKEFENEHDMQRRVIFHSTKLGGDISSLDTEAQVDYKEGWGEESKQKYPYGTRFKISVNLNIPNDFIKSIFTLPTDCESVIYLQNIKRVLIRESCKYIKDNFTNEIIPINVSVESKLTDDPGVIDRTRFVDAIFFNTDYQRLRILKDEAIKGEVYFWYDNNLKNKKKFCAMYKFTIAKNGVSHAARLFFRGIRFGEAKFATWDTLSKLVQTPGFDCDINIMSGEAKEYIEINRDFVKKESSVKLKGFITDGLIEFYTDLINIIKKLTVQPLESYQQEFASKLKEILRSSREFAQQLLVYMVAENSIFSEELSYFFSEICGGTFDVALFDKRVAKIAFAMEPISMNNLPKAKFIDYSVYEQEAIIELDNNDPRLSVSSPDDGYMEKAIRNNFPMLSDFKFNKIEAYPKASSQVDRIVKLYTLTKSLKHTYIDVNSYRVICNDIISEYGNRFTRKEERQSYFPVFPSPSTTNPPFGIGIDAVKYIAVNVQPPDENSYCDDRYVSFALSPFPLDVLLNWDDYVIVSADGDYEAAVRDLFKKLNKSVELKTYYKQLLSFIKQNSIYNDSRAEMDDNELEKQVLNYWEDYSVYLAKILSREM